MSDSLDALKNELERFAEANDAATTERSRRMLNITVNVQVRPDAETYFWCFPGPN